MHVFEGHAVDQQYLYSYTHSIIHLCVTDGATVPVYLPTTPYPTGKDT